MNIPDEHMPAIIQALLYVSENSRDIRLNSTWKDHADFMKRISEAIRSCRRPLPGELEQAPQPPQTGPGGYPVEPDWSRLENWAQHYTRDASGRAMQWETKPYFDGGMGIWMNEDDSLRAAAAMPPLIRDRPTTDGTGA